MIDVIARFCNDQKINFSDFCKMVDTYNNDQDYWINKSLWALFDASKTS